ncbi:hypothetical protein diail_7785 [Diaporthe ilicicola]|nr:hypothetical protein diail_7785 [Diaporthe ilicicola]
MSKPAPLLEGEVFDAPVTATEETGPWSESAYYMNHKANAECNSKAPNGGCLGKDKPVLFIHAKFDFACNTLTSLLADPMREVCENLTEVAVGTGHNAHFEKPGDINSAVVRCLVEEVKECWPGHSDSGYHKVKT